MHAGASSANALRSIAAVIATRSTGGPKDMGMRSLPVMASISWLCSRRTIRPRLHPSSTVNPPVKSALKSKVARRPFCRMTSPCPPGS